MVVSTQVICLGRKYSVCSAEAAPSGQPASAEFVCFASNPPSHEIHENFHENTKNKKNGWTGHR